MLGVIRNKPLPAALSEDQILIRVYAWAMNPCDALLQDTALPIVTYPVVLGQDVAGEVTEVGASAAAKFSVGDRVFGFSLNNGFQDDAVLDYRLAAEVPQSMPYRSAAVFPLCATTAAAALFGEEYLGLPLPSRNAAPAGKSLLVWGGSSAVGSNAIQLACGAGFQVVATCSPRNFDYVKSLGANQVFDYNSSSIIQDVVAALDGGVCAGIYVAAGRVADACQVSAKSKHSLFVATTTPVQPWDAPDGVEAKMTYGTGGFEMFYDTAMATFGGYLAEGVHSGTYKVAPEPEVVPTKGLEGIQEALDILKKGVSAKKLIVERE